MLDNVNYTKFTIFNILYDKAAKWIEEEANTKGSIVGNMIKHMTKKGKMREAQIQAIIIYLWLKEIGKNKKLSQLIKDGDFFDEYSSLFYPGDENFLSNPTKRFINRYLEDAKIKNKDSYLGINASQDVYEDFIDNLFEDFNYPNFLFSLPMGSGKTYLIAAFIYIDLYMLQKTNDKSYSSNFIILAPSAKKTAILPALRTVKNFNPSWILPENEALELKRLIKIEVLDESPNADKLQNQNPNLAKINRTINGHSIGNVFILNAEKILTVSNLSDEQLENLPLPQQTKTKRAESIKEALSKIKNIQVFLDEAHHSYSSDSETKKLRQQLDVINKYGNIKTCIGMSGTPYIERKVKFMDKIIKINDIQDIVFYYPMINAIQNFLKYPDIRQDKRNETSLIESALDVFFDEYDIIYKNNTKSKIAFYCPSIDKLNEEVLPIIYNWYEKHNRNKNEILRYYTNVSKKYPLPSENLIHFLNLDNPTSTYRVVLLVAVGTEGWDCKSLTSVVLPRQDSAKNFVLQTSCRCLREVVDASCEKALIYLDESNYKILDEELNVNYHLSIADLKNKAENHKNYPVVKIRDNLGVITYKEVHDEYFDIIDVPDEEIDYKKALELYNFEKFKELHPFVNQVGVTTITSGGLNDSIRYKDIDETNYNYSFVDFIYELEKSSFGNMSAAKLMEYKKELQLIYNKITKQKNLSWIVNHPEISTLDVCKDITSIFTKPVTSIREVVSNNISVNFLDWNLENKPVISVSEEKKYFVFPENAYDDIENGLDFYDENVEEIKRRYNNKMKFANKEKSFSYLPYRMDSSYEFNFLKNALANMDDLNVELHYNGYKNENLQSLRIITPYGKYTPDFVLFKRDDNGNIAKIMLIETKGHPFETPEKERYIKTVFLQNNPNFSYEKIGDTKDDPNEYNKMVGILKNFDNL